MRGTGSGYDALYEGGNFQGRGIKNFFSAPLVWSFINKAMPLQRQGHLTMDEVYSLTAFLLYRNGLIQEDDVMDANSLPRVQLPGRETYAYNPQHPAWSNWKPGLPKKVSK
jgi:cytochrome c